MRIAASACQQCRRAHADIALLVLVPPFADGDDGGDGSDFTWGVFSDFTESYGGDVTLSAAEACPGCGATCDDDDGGRRLEAKERTPNPTPDGCVDFVSGDGSEWRDSWCYTCDAYAHGNFCVAKDDGTWGAGGLWNIDQYGAIADYAYFGKPAGSGEAAVKVPATVACCACGGGVQAATCGGGCIGGIIGGCFVPFLILILWMGGAFAPKCPSPIKKKPGQMSSVANGGSA